VDSTANIVTDANIQATRHKCGDIDETCSFKAAARPKCEAIHRGNDKIMPIGIDNAVNGNIIRANIDIVINGDAAYCDAAAVIVELHAVGTIKQSSKFSRINIIISRVALPNVHYP